MTKLKEITIAEAIQKATSPLNNVYMVVQISHDTTIEQLEKAACFLELDQSAQAKTTETPQKAEKSPKSGEKLEPLKIDHGKIIALHKAAWSVKKIAEEMDISEQTVRNHIARERNGNG